MERFTVIGNVMIGFQFDVMAESPDAAAKMADEFAIYNQIYSDIQVHEIFYTETGELAGE